jgi:hypothetical protein
VVEPALAQRTQLIVWSAGYFVFALLAGVSGWCVIRTPGMVAHVQTPAARDAVPTSGDYGGWLAWPFTAVVLLLAVTNELCQNTAAIPFLWVLPLSLYLLTYILCFASPAWYRRWLYMPLLVACVFLVTQTSFVLLPEDTDVRIDIGFWSLALFCACMVCHGELSRARPAPRYLTAYYLMIALAGAGGGLFVGVIAPRVFRTFVELPIGALLLFLLILVTLLTDTPRQTRRERLRRGLISALYIVAVAGGLLYVVWERDEDETIIARTRNFYGVLKVAEEDLEEQPGRRLRTLKHGGILHGAQ